MIRLKKTVKAAVLCGVVVATIAVSGGVAYTKQGNAGVISGNGIRVRSLPNASSKILTSLNKGTTVQVIESKNGWNKISRNSTVGWVYGNYISGGQVKAAPSVAGEYATICADNVNFRSGHGKNFRTICTLKKNTNVQVVNSYDQWKEIKLQSGQRGWVCSNFLNVRGTSLANRGGQISRSESSASTRLEGSSIGQKAVNLGKNFLGVRYVYGASGPNAFDCSGFVSYVYKKTGIGLPRVAAAQATQGIKIDRSQLSPGDLVFFDTNGKHNYINHVGMYIGGNKFIHASSGKSSHKVVISDLSGFYDKTYMTARRLGS